MRPAARLLASVTRNSSQFLEAGTPTGLTGLPTHASPRSTLLYLYSSTLEKLRSSFPEHSVYRQSTEALTSHRMNIIESVQPAGLKEWQERVAPLVSEHPKAFKKIKVESAPKADGSGGLDFNIVFAEPAPEAERSMDDQVNAEYKSKPQLEGPRTEAEVGDRGAKLSRDFIGEAGRAIRVEPEPPLSVDQISELEEKIAAGLIEEVIQVAEGEKKLAETLAEHQVWEDLEEKPAEGQWAYHERVKNTGETQAP